MEGGIWSTDIETLYNGCAYQMCLRLTELINVLKVWDVLVRVKLSFEWVVSGPNWLCYTLVYSKRLSHNGDCLSTRWAKMAIGLLNWAVRYQDSCWITELSEHAPIPVPTGEGSGWYAHTETRGLIYGSVVRGMKRHKSNWNDQCKCLREVLERLPVQDSCSRACKMLCRSMDSLYIDM